MANRRLFSLFLHLLLVAGFFLLLYPGLSSACHARRHTRTAAGYSRTTSRLSREEREALWKAAQSYNQGLPASDLEQYNALLNPAGDGMLGILQIPRLGCTLPVYHGTEAAVLEKGVGHLYGTSLPVGGPGTHGVLTGHRGLPQAELFTNLDQLEAGDIFFLVILDRTLVYQVDRIQVAEPGDTAALSIQEGQDLCTLVTCTPYGINSHRLLVRGRRVESPSS